MQFLARLTFCLVACGAVVRAEHAAHRCIAGSEAFVCMIPSFTYDPEENIPQFHLPNDTHAVRFVPSFYFTPDTEECIHVYDALLHKQLNSPIAIEVRECCMHAVEIPSNLQYGDFTDNNIDSIIAPANQSYALRYLSLNHNMRLKPSAMGNISRFVNLETLYVADCDLEELPEGLFKNLNRLKRLFLGGNSFTKIDLSVLPSSLTVLNLDQNKIAALDFPSNHFPVLEHLNVEFNALSDADVGSLLAMAPKLKLFSIGHNEIKRGKLIIMLGELDRRNVAYYNVELPTDSDCLHDERKFRGVCIPESSFPLETGDWIEIVLLVALAVTVLVGVVFGGIKLWAKYPPSWQLVNYLNRTN